MKRATVESSEQSCWQGYRAFSSHMHPLSLLDTIQKETLATLTPICPHYIRHTLWLVLASSICPPSCSPSVPGAAWLWWRREIWVRAPHSRRRWRRTRARPAAPLAGRRRRDRRSRTPALPWWSVFPACSWAACLLSAQSSSWPRHSSPLQSSSTALSIGQVPMGSLASLPKGWIHTNTHSRESYHRGRERGKNTLWDYCWLARLSFLDCLNHTRRKGHLHPEVMDIQKHHMGFGLVEGIICPCFLTQCSWGTGDVRTTWKMIQNY